MSKVYTVKDLDNPPPEFKHGMKVRFLFRRDSAIYYGFTPGVPIDGTLSVIKSPVRNYYNVSEPRHGQWHDYVELFTLVGAKRKIGVFKPVS